MARADRNNSARLWLDANTPGLSLMLADFKTQEYAPHHHDAMVIAVTEAGGSMIKSRGTVEKASASALLALNPAEAQSSWMGASQRWCYRSFYLEQPAIDAVTDGVGIGGVPYFTTNLFPDRDLVRGFLSLHRAIQAGEGALRERELLIGTFGNLISRHGSNRRPVEPAPWDRARLKLAVDLIQSSLGGNLLLEDLSAALGFTQYQLIRFFKRMTGLTPHAYVTQLRLDAARRHLAAGLPIREAALAAGFYDQSALTRYFKRTYGVTPSEFAHAARPD